MTASRHLPARAAAMLLSLAVALPASAAHGAEFTRTVATVKQSVVGVGTYQRTRSPAIRFVATGFAVGDGLSIITNAHSIPELLDSGQMETLGIVTGSGDKVAFRPATLAGVDKEHDLAHLRLAGAPLPALAVGDSSAVMDGTDLAFTGYPLGMALGLNPATHRAMLAAVTPVVMPSLGSRNLSPKVISQLQKSPFSIFQLDATAYPGNSGSPLYDPATGTVYGVINGGLLKGLKEAAITNPSGISYAIPSSHVKELLVRTTRPGQK